MKVKSNTTNKDLPWRFGLYHRPLSEENGTNSSSGKLQFWIQSLTEAPDGSKRRCTFERRDEVLWTGMMVATHWATLTTDFLPCHITTVALTGRRISFIFFWRRPL